MRRLMRHLQSDRTLLLWYLLVLIALGFIFLFIGVAIIRLRFPYELEWIEGANIDQMRWILSGKPLYGPPDIHFIPNAKTPLFFYLSAGLMKWVGTGFIAPRLISILSTFGCFLFILLIVRQDDSHLTPGLIAAGIYAACYALTGMWMDLAKVDSLFMMLILAGFYTNRAQSGKVMAITSGSLFAMAYFTKQVALPIIMIYAPISMIISRGKTWLSWLTAFVLGIGAFIFMDYSSQGWFSFYTFKTITRHTIVAGWWPFWKLLLPKMWPAMMLVLIFLLYSQKRTLPWRWKLSEHTWHCLGFSLALILTSWSIYFKIWTYNNDLMPACAAIAILAGLGAKEAIDRHTHQLTSANFLFNIAVMGLLLLQFVFLLYNPVETIPSYKTYQANNKFITHLNSLPGEVFNLSHGYVNYLAGKTTYLHGTPLSDVTIGEFPSGSNTYQRQKQVKQVFNQAIEDQIFDWVILDKYYPMFFPYYIQVGYFMLKTNANYPGRTSSIIPHVLLKKNPVAHGGILALNDTRLDYLFSQGWSAPEAGERCTNNTQAMLLVALEGQAAYDLQVTVHPFCSSGKLAVDRMQLLWNSRPLGDLDLNSCNLLTGSFSIPAESLRYQENNQLLLKLHQPTPKSDLIQENPSHQPVACFSRITFSRK
jgi:hypothetical protein